MIGVCSEQEVRCYKPCTLHPNPCCGCGCICIACSWRFVRSCAPAVRSAATAAGQTRSTPAPIARASLQPAPISAQPLPAHLPPRGGRAAASSRRPQAIRCQRAPSVCRARVAHDRHVVAGRCGALWAPLACRRPPLRVPHSFSGPSHPALPAPVGRLRRRAVCCRHPSGRPAVLDRPRGSPSAAVGPRACCTSGDRRRRQRTRSAPGLLLLPSTF